MNEAEKKEIESLRNTIHRHDYLYYVKNSPAISDREYDSLYCRLKELEDRHPESVTSDSPTQRIGGKAEQRFEQVVHPMPMLSLDNTYNIDEVGVPVLKDAMVSFSCNVSGTHVYGDHTIYVGEVVNLSQSDGSEPLMFYQSRWYHPHKS